MATWSHFNRNGLNLIFLQEVRVRLPSPSLTLTPEQSKGLCALRRLHRRQHRDSDLDAAGRRASCQRAAHHLRRPERRRPSGKGPRPKKPNLRYGARTPTLSFHSSFSFLTVFFSCCCAVWLALCIYCRRVETPRGRRLILTQIRGGLSFLGEGILSTTDNESWKEQRAHLIEAFLPMSSLQHICPVTVARARRSMSTLGRARCEGPAGTVGEASVDINEFFLHEVIIGPKKKQC